MNTNSIRFKASVLYSGILCVILVCFSVYVYQSVQSILYKNVREELANKANQIDVFIDVYATTTQSGHSPASLMNELLTNSGEGITDKSAIDRLWEKDSQSLGLHKDFFRILSLKGLTILRSENMTSEEEIALDARFSPLTNKPSYAHLQCNGVDYYGINYPIRFSDRSTFILQLATPLATSQQVLFKLVFSIISGIAIILLLSIFIGSFLTQRILKPVTDVTRIATNISHKNLHLRIPAHTMDHEMELLVESFNLMIERLERSFAHVNEFSSHVAHEMKTPLAIMKGELELALGAGNTTDEDRRVMTATLEEIDRLTKTIKDLLLLAKYEYQIDIFKMEKMDAAEFLKDICQHSKILAAEKNIKLELSAPDRPIWIQGDAVHLRRIFFNLVHNAIKFTPTGGEIKILADVRDKQVFISVKDTGIGIAPNDQGRIFERFYRIRRTDQVDTEGTGLGLSVARLIARAHGGDITFKSESGKGSVFTVTLPIWQS